MEKWWYSKNYGGKREGAGRPAIGTAKPMKITLPDHHWALLDEMIANEDAKNRPDAIRKIIGHYADERQVDIYDAIKRAQEVDRDGKV